MANQPPRRNASAFRTRLLGCTAVLSVVQALSGAAWAQSTPASGALPTGGQVQSGVASIASAGSAMTVNQTTDKAIISWNQFNIGSGASVTFQQPSTSSMTLNRVRGGETSLIEGALRAPGTVILVNPSGVIFGGGSTVDVGGIVASTLDIADEDFEKGNLSFRRGTSDGAITNQGSITARGGSVVLLASQITNRGYIRAELGSVVLAAGETVTLTPDGGAPLKVDASLIRAEIEAGGIIQTSGGAVYLSARAMNKVNAGVIKATGVIEADSLTEKGGQIVLDASGPITLQSALFSAKGATGGGTVLVGDAQTNSVTMDADSRIDASATQSGKGGTVIVNSRDTATRGVILARGGTLWGDGGFVETSGHELAFDGIKVDVGAAAGKGGNWLLDPFDLTVNAAYADAIEAALASGNVTLQTTNTAVNVTGVAAGGTTNASGNGDILVNSGITWTSANALTLDAYRGVTVNAAMSGTSLSIVTNNGGTGGRFAANAPVDLTTGLNINGTTYQMVTSAAQLSSFTAAGSYALAQNLTLSGAWTPIGFNTASSNASPTVFTGSFEGLGHTISGLTLNQTGSSSMGLFSSIGSTGSVANLLLTNGTINTGLPTTATTGWGFLSGRLSGTVFNSSASGTITASRTTGLGGLVGVVNGGTILSSHTNVAITTGTVVTAVGGLAGQAVASPYISDSYANANITLFTGNLRVGGLLGETSTLSLFSSYAIGTITSSNSSGQSIGGLVGGVVGGTISGTYAAVNITLANASLRIGGLVGVNSGTIRDSYATGSISIGGTGNQHVGGLVGINSQPLTASPTAHIINSYASGNVTVGNATATAAAATNVGGLVGQMQNGAVVGSFATGAVSVGRSATYVGGLVGSAEAFNTTSSSVLGSYATGLVSGGSVVTDIGGLVGRANGALVSGSYATGGVTALVGAIGVGGLVGQVAISGTVVSTVANSWAGGSVASVAGVSVGGLIGRMTSGTVTTSYWDISTSGLTVGFGTSVSGSFSATGVSGTAAYSSASYSNFDFTSVWYMVEGSTRPFLRSENKATIVNAHQLQAIAINPSGTYVLGANITLAGLTGQTDLWASGFVPVAFSGTLNGQGNSIRDLTLSSTSSGSLGLFSTIGTTGSVSNLTLTGGSITGGGDYLGLLAGVNQGRISAVAANGGVTALGSASYAGGMVGSNTGTIDSSYATGTVTAGSAAQMVGGLLGRNDGIVTNSYASATVKAGSGAQDIGGLVGRNTGTVANAYALGSVSVSGSGTNVAGFAGNNLGTLSNIYATGSVIAGSSSTNVGGLAGASSSVISAAYWDRTTTGQTVAVGSDSGSTTNVAGFTSGDAYSSATYASFNFSSGWYLLEGLTRPILRAEYSTTISNAHQLQLVTLDLAGTYVLGGNIDMAELSSASGVWKTSSGFVPIGVTSASASSAFSGSFNGQGYAINNLFSRVDTLSNPAGGLFAQISSGAVVQNLGIHNATVTNMGSSGTAIGALAGINAGTVSNVYATGVLTVGDGWENVGGLIGANSGSITNAYATVAVTVGTSASHAIGGLVGYNTGWISAVYASGQVTVGAGGVSVGGLVGDHAGGTILSAYWDSSSSGQSAVLGSGTATITDVSGTAAYASATYSGLDLVSTWYMVNGYTRPFLRSEYSKTISNAHQLQLISLDPNARYDIVANITMTELTQTGSLWSSNGWVPIGFNTASSNTSPTAFAGTLNGGGYVVSGMTIGNGASHNLGLFSLISPTGQVSNLTLSNARVTTTSGVSQVGLFAGQNQGTVSNVYVAGTLDLTGTASTSGGLIGLNSGRINNSAAHVTVQINGRGQFIGGLVGQHSVGSIYDVYATGSITSGDSSIRIGGLVGVLTAGGSISNAYSTVDLSIGTSAISIGGLVGLNNGSTISASYAANSVTLGSGASFVGGLVGAGSGVTAILIDSFWDVAKSGLTVGYNSISTSGAIAGLSTAEWFSNGPIAQSVFSSNNWVQGYPYPVLKALPYITLTGSGTGTYGQAAGSVSIVSALDQNGGSITSGLSTAGLTWAPAAASSSVGTATIGGSGASYSGGVYQFAYTGTLAITPAALTVTASGVTKTYGNAVSVTGYTTSGLVTGDSIASVTLLPSGGTSVGDAPGTYTISASGATGTGLSNYSITYVAGSLVVDPAALTITASNVTKTYGNAVSVTGFTSSGLVNGDTLTGVTLLASGGTGTAANAGSYTISVSGAAGTGLSNYSITYTNGTLVVNPAALTVTASGATKTYGNAISLTGYTSSGLINGDSISAVSLTSTGAGTASNVGSYTISGSGATGTGLSNYSITYAEGTLVVNPAALTVTASGATKTYGNSISLTGFTSNGLVNADSVTAVSLTSTGAGTTATVGSYTISASGATGTGLSNYSITYANGTLVVDPAALTVTASGATKTYGNSISLTGFTSNGLV
uniref:MBG domain-containing protein n=1 Tax=Niveispirillum sp. TaxID=1917217 RepID=UPI003BA62DEE